MLRKGLIMFGLVGGGMLLGGFVGGGIASSLFVHNMDDWLMPLALTVGGGLAGGIAGAFAAAALT